MRYIWWILRWCCFIKHFQTRLLMTVYWKHWCCINWIKTISIVNLLKFYGHILMLKHYMRYIWWIVNSYCKTKLLLFDECRNRVRKDCIKGIFNRAAWGYLKQLREEKDKLTLRNKLRLTLNSLQKRYSSLQVYDDWHW